MHSGPPTSDLAHLGNVAVWEAAEAPFAASRSGSGPASRLVTLTAVTADGGPVVCFSAPHAVEQQRQGRVKYSEPFTAALALLSAQELGQAAVAACGELNGDANWDEQHPLKQWLGQSAPDAVVDLHMMRDTHGVDVSLGLGLHPILSRDLLECLLPELESAGFACGINEPFDAARATTVTSYAQALGCAAIQIEIAVRNLMGEPARRADLARALISGVRRYRNR